jgi:RHS repeat-associated protein
MTSFTGGSNPTWNYDYRADGLRMSKANVNASTSFAYDGQMGIEDADFNGGVLQAVTDYAIGARGIDRMAKISGGNTNVLYPIYDGHGNMVSTLSYSGSSASLSNQRAFDAWGNIRNSDTSGDPKGRYCASLGHKADDESGLTYMRARYYDPGCGRFVSEDSKCFGINWFSYCSNGPLDSYDRDGHSQFADNYAWAMLVAALGQMVIAMALGPAGRVTAIAGIAFLLSWVISEVQSGAIHKKSADEVAADIIRGALMGTIMCGMGALVEWSESAARYTFMDNAAGAVLAWSATITAFIGVCLLEEDSA